MTTHKEALKLALEALKKSDGFLYNWHENYSDDEADAYAAARQLNEQAIIAAEKALMSFQDGAQPEQNPNDLAAYVIGCFRAAEVEGLQEALAETTDERLKDLVERRLMYALYEAQKRQPKEPEQEPAWYHAECDDPDHSGFFKEAIDAVTQVNEHGGFVAQLYTTPPQRTWVGLTDVEINEIWASQNKTGEKITRDIEAKLKEKNT